MGTVRCWETKFTDEEVRKANQIWKQHPDFISITDTITKWNGSSILWKRLYKLYDTIRKRIIYSEA